MQRNDTMTLPAKKGTPSHLFIFLHGVGAGAADMLPLASALTGAFPEIAAAVPSGFDAFDLMPRGRQWFSIKDVTEENRPERVRQALPRLIALVRTLQEEHGVSAENTVLVGFSQGGIMALEAAKTPGIASRVISLGSRFASLPEQWPAATSVHFLHGAQDSVIPTEHSRHAATCLQSLGAAVRLDVVEGGHAVSAAMMRAVIAGVREDLGLRAAGALQAAV